MMKLDFIDRLVLHHVERQIENKDGSLNMNVLESFAVTIVMGILQQVVKNPAHAAAVKGQLVGVATEILATYGYTVTPPTVPAA
jgi:uncharacterized membrane protein